MMKNPSSIERIAFLGEQILSYQNDLRTTPCPRCGQSKLSFEFVGKDIMVRCSVDLIDYNAEEWEDVIPGVCTYAQHVQPIDLSSEPFTLRFATGRPTAKNLPKPKTRTRRKTTGS